MLILTRRNGESLVIGETIKVSILDVKRDHVKIGIQAPKDVTIYREEIFLRIQADQKESETAETE